MQFGVFDHLDRNDLALREYYESRLQIIEAYDRLGFYAYHVAEHHSTPLGLAPSPSIFLSAVAQRTRRLRFGPLVYALPLYHPLRMIEEICMLDQLSGGRLEIGFGRGSVPAELIYYGQNPEQAQAVYAEAVLAFLRTQLAGTGSNYCVGQFAFGDLSLEDTLRSIELFAHHIMPQLAADAMASAGG